MSILKKILNDAPAGFEYEFIILTEPFAEIVDEAASEVAFEAEDSLSGLEDKQMVAVINFQPVDIGMTFKITIFLEWCSDCQTVHFRWHASRPDVFTGDISNRISQSVN